MSAHYEQAKKHPELPSDDKGLINDLPSELLVQIMAVAYWLCRIDKISWDTNWTVPYQLVCRRWRDVICLTPQFWQEIDVSSSQTWLELCFKRCAGAPASVEVWDPTLPDEIFGTLRRHASSIRSFHLHCEVPLLDDLSGLPSLIATPMTALETLSLTGPFWEDEILDVPLTHDLVPRLVSLELWNCAAPRDAAVYTSLRSLSLLGNTISEDEILDLLGKCHSLEHLRLGENVLDPSAGELAVRPAGTQRRMTPLVLPHVKSMTLQGHRPAVFHFLATISLPRATTVELKNRLDNDEPGILLTHLLPPNLQRRIPFLSSIRTVYLNCWDEEPFQLSLQCGPDGDALFSIDCDLVYNTYWPRSRYLNEDNLVAIIDLFSVASVDSLEIEGCVGHVSVGTWQRGRGTLDFLWSGLAAATTSSLERGGAVCCPSLLEIGADDRPCIASRFKFTATPQLFDNVLGALSARENAGAVRLKKVQLYLEFTDELWKRTSERRETWVEDVKALVEELDYREWQV